MGRVEHLVVLLRRPIRGFEERPDMIEQVGGELAVGRWVEVRWQAVAVMGFESSKLS